MRPAVWRAMTLAYGTFLVLLALVGAYAGVFDNAGPGFTTKLVGQDLHVLTVTKVDDPAALSGPLHAGDTVRLAEPSLFNRIRFTRERPGERFAFVRRTPDGHSSLLIATMTRHGPASPAYWSFLAMGLAFVIVAMTIAARRPDDALVRLLVGLFFGIATIMLGSAPPYAPVWVAIALLALQETTQPFVAYAALALAVSFPRKSAGGVRHFMERANPWFFAFCVAVLVLAFGDVLLRLQRPPGILHGLGIAVTIVYYASIVVAFVLASRGIDNADRKRLQWVAWTLAAGFSGQIVLISLIIAGIMPTGDIAYINLTLLAIPFGLGYAIVRHRVIDIGFVVSRALVFGTVSAIVVLAFGALEWLLGTVLVRVSHITSAALELALALALGFWLRGIHTRVDRFIDDLFFRARHDAERALRAFARDLAFVTNPRVAIDRTYDALAQRTGAAGVAIYVVDGPTAVRVDLGEVAGAARVDVDDPALVRMRATRAPLALREVESAFSGDRAFPMRVRDAVAGAVVLGPKTTGETYAPDEIATIETVAVALAVALDALHTAALKAELARVLVDGGSIDALRRTADSAAWVRGVVPQPAGSLTGLIE